MEDERITSSLLDDALRIVHTAGPPAHVFEQMALMAAQDYHGFMISFLTSGQGRIMLYV
jgi:hypothetical protein